MNSHRYTLKFAVIFLLIVLLLIPQGLLMGLISERESWRSAAHLSMSSWSSANPGHGPILSIPYTFSYDLKGRRFVSRLARNAR
ncbi:MAG: inner membrane CreD family protein [Thiolinea sp.]